MIKSIACVVLALLPLVAGCSSRGGTVTCDSLSQNKVLTENFNQAYIMRTKSGEYDILLVDSASDWEYKGTATKKNVLQPVSLAPVRQALHIHLYWRAVRGTTKNPVAINSSIDWYVLGPEGTNDVLVYEGAGFVLTDPSGRVRDVKIRDGTIHLKSKRGDLQDPIGTANISGVAVARENESRVKDTLAELQQHVEGK